VELPITESELDVIIEKIKASNPQLYAKLWSYKINYRKKEQNNGFS
jgi:hypothetical protein